MLFLIVVYVLLFQSKSEYTCNADLCLESEIGDNSCNILCMFPECNYDSPFYSDNLFSALKSSDCFILCNCDESKLTNGICDSECSTPECGFDLGDCGYCSNGCFLKDLEYHNEKSECSDNTCQNMLNVRKKTLCAPGCALEDFNGDVCLEECNNIDCISVHYSPCSLMFCAPMCKRNKIVNNICDSSCNNHECFYDNGKCDCSPGCYDTKGECTSNEFGKDPCDTKECKYKDGKCGFCASDCFENNLGDGICQTQCNVESCNYDYGDCGCAPRCTFKYDNLASQFVQTGESYECQNECLTLNCHFALDFCYDENYIYDRVLNFIDNDKHNHNIFFDDFCPNGYEEKEKLSNIFGNSYWCLKEAVHYSKSYYKEIYVDSTASINGNGAKDYPTKTLYNALVNIYATFTKILLVNSEIDFYIDDSTSIFVTDIYDPLNIAIIYEIYELWIIGNYSESEKTVVYWKDNLKISPIAHKFYMKNIELVGKYVLNKDCQFETCYYCPNVLIFESLYDDGGNIIEYKHYINHAFNCYTFNMVNVFSFSRDAYIENVNFVSFRNQFNSFLKTSAVLNLKNVNFNKMQAKSLGSIILLEPYSTFSYIQGVVNDTGAGYNDNYDVTTGSFIIGINAQNILIKNVSFSYNFLFHHLRSLDKGYLIYSKNHLGTLSIEDCVFENNYVNYLVYIDVRSLVYDNSITVKGIILGYSLQHFSMKNIQIRNTYCSHGLIMYLMLGVVHNIQIMNFVMSDSVIGGYGVFAILNDKSLVNSDINGEYVSSIIVDIFEPYYIFIPPRYLKLEKVIIENSKIAKYCVYIVNFPNVSIKDISIENIVDGTVNDIKNIISSFYNSGRYFYFINIYNEVPKLNCYEMVKISDSVNISIDYLKISSILCKNQELTLGISLYKISGNVNITNITLTHLQAQRTSGIALTAIDLNSIRIIDMEIHNIINFKESILEFENCNQIIIDSALISDVSSMYTSTFIVTNSTYFSLSNFEFRNMSSIYNSGGCLSILNGISDSTYEIFFGIFTKCSSRSSKGGAISLDSLTVSSTVLFKMHDVGIYGCDSYEGSAIFISNTVNFSSKEKSGLKGLVINDNYSKSGGAISDYHYSELLIIDRLEMERNNQGIHSYYSNENSQLKISNTNIYAQDISSSALYINCLIPGPVINLQNVKIFNSTILALEANNAKIYMVEVSMFNSNTAISFSDHSVCDSYDLKIVNSKKEVIKLENNCTFYCKNCEISQSSIIISANSNSNFIFENSTIFSNTLDSRYFFSVSSGGSKESSLINCHINSNSLLIGSLIYLLSSSFTINNCSFRENNAYSASIQFIYLFNSKLNIIDSNFNLNGKVNKASILYAESGSFVIAENTFFQNSHSMIENIYGIQVSINFNNCTFLGNYGGDIYTIESNLIITKSIFEKSFLSFSNTGNIKIKKNIETVIKDSFFEYNSAMLNLNTIALVHDESSKKLEISNSNFLGSNNSLMAVFAKESQKVLIENSTFYGHSTFDSTLTFLSDIEGLIVSIINSKITNNWSGRNGGAIYSENYNLIIENTEISFNTAQKSGGGIYFKSPKCDSCGIYLIRETKIFNNSCTDDGGAIKWEDYKPSLDDDVQIYNNSAAYGSNLAATPANFGLLQSRSLSDTYFITFLNITPGKKFAGDIQIFIYDTYGQTVTTENSITAVLSINESEKSVAAISGSTNFIAKNGILTITDFTLTGVPGSMIYLKLKSDNMIGSSARNDETKYLNSMFIKVHFSDCTNGEQIQATACIDCLSGKYLLKASENCLNCPSGADCPGGDAIIVKDGYWRSSLESDVIYECEVFDACVKGNEINELGNCSTGYTGVLCKSCEIGYSKIANGICTKCPDKNANFVSMVFLCASIISISFLMVKTTLTSAFSPKSLHSIYIKIFTNYLQLISIVTQFDLEWPSYVAEFLIIQRSAASVSEQIFSFDCYITIKTQVVIQNVYYFKLVIVSLLPIVITIVSYLYWIIHGMVVESFKSLKREVYTTIIVIFFLAYQTIVKLMFANFSCIEVDKMKSYLNDNTSVECWDLNHKKYSFIIALPSIILWAIGVPTILLLLMIKNSRRLHLDYYRVVFGFLYNGYKQRRFYWEINIMYRKILLITIAVFKVAQTRVLQTLYLVLVLLASIYLHHSYKPYNSSELNNMEMQALNVAAITIYFGLFYISKSVGESIEIILFIFIVLGNGYFILYWIYYMAQALVDVFIKFFPRFRLLLKRGDAFDEEFYVEEIEREGANFNRLEGKKVYTLIKIKTKNENENEKFKYKSIEDAYIDTAKRDIERIKIVEVEENN